MASGGRIVNPHDGLINRTLLNSPQIGVVKDNIDPENMGRLKVWIKGSNTLENDPSGWIICNYASPFAGATDPETLGNNIQDPSSTQQSYGFWSVPPDTGNNVIVLFINGDIRKAFWVACLYQKNMNYMVPGIADGISFQGDEYGANAVPVSEYNKLGSNPNLRPVFGPLADGLEKQGLLTDTLRGAGSTSARRESPSQVHGWKTPGGNQFMMDDGNGSELIRIRTKSGAQVLISETDGHIYAISRDGKCWLELNNDGYIDGYALKGIDFNTPGDFNIRAEGNVNIEAGGDVNVKGISAVNIQAETDDININAQSNVNVQTVGNDINIKANEKVNVQSGTEINAKSGANTNIQSAADINATAANSANVKSSSGAISLNGQSGVNMVGGGASFSLSSGNYNVSVPGNYILNVNGNYVIWASHSVSNNFTGSLNNSHPAAPAAPTAPAVAGSSGTAAIPVIYQQSLRNEDGQEAPVESICDRIPDEEPWPLHASTTLGLRQTVQEGTSTASTGSVTPDAAQPLPVVGTPTKGMTPGVYAPQGYTPKGDPVYSFSGATSALLPVNQLKLSPEGLDFIAGQEGFSASKYKDASGFSIGYGHFIIPTDPANIQSGPISQETGRQLLSSDATKAQNTIRKYVTVPLTQAQFDALTDFIFNVGGGNFQKSTLLKELNQGNYADVPNQLMKWNKSQGKVLDVLTKRRRLEGLLFARPAPTS